MKKCSSKMHQFELADPVLLAASTLSFCISKNQFLTILPYMTYDVDLGPYAMLLHAVLVFGLVYDGSNLPSAYCELSL